MTYPCDDCNFQTGHSTCWYLGPIPFAEMFHKCIHGCEKHRSWWTITSVRTQE